MTSSQLPEIPPLPPDFSFSSYPPYRRENAPATFAIVGSCIVVFFVQFFFKYFMNSDAVGQLLAFSPMSFLDGHYWQILSYAWVHSTSLPIHILFNMLMVWVLGGEIERILGSLRFLMIYLGGAIAAALTFWVFAPFQWEGVEGASGSAFALLTALAVLCPNRRLSVLLLFVIPMRMKVVTLAWVTCGIEVICMIFDWLPFVSHSAHLGGALFGVALTFLLKPSRPPQPPPLIFTTGIFPPS